MFVRHSVVALHGFLLFTPSVKIDYAIRRLFTLREYAPFSSQLKEVRHV